MKSPSAAGPAYHEDRVEGDTLPALPDAPRGGTHAPGAEELFFDAMVPGALDSRQYHEHPPVEHTTGGQTPVAPESLHPQLQAFALLLAQQMAAHLPPVDAVTPAQLSREAAARRLITGNVTLAANGNGQLIGADAQRRELIITATAAVTIAATMAEAQAGVGLAVPANTPVSFRTSAEVWMSSVAGATIGYASLTEALERASDVSGPAR